MSGIHLMQPISGSPAEGLPLAQWECPLFPLHTPCIGLQGILRTPQNCVQKEEEREIVPLGKKWGQLLHQSYKHTEHVPREAVGPGMHVIPPYLGCHVQPNISQKEFVMGTLIMWQRNIHWLLMGEYIGSMLQHIQIQICIQICKPDLRTSWRRT